jgi:hypothetical protein
MSLAPGDLPLLLAGPVLRRVEADLVCVWIATSQPCNASLLLFDGGDVAASDTPLGDQRAEWVSAVQPTLPIGPHLHVLAITLDLRTPGGNAVRSNGALLPNRTYSYDLNFFTRDDPATRHTLLTEKLLDDPLPLGYDRGELPSFLSRRTSARAILHGSCRELFAVPPVEDDPALDDVPFEPPGGWPTAEVSPDDPVPVPDPENDPFPSDAYPTFPKRDGMLWVDALIDQRASLPQFRFAGRPHQLFLTGDQIYADSMWRSFAGAEPRGRVLGDEDLGSSPLDAPVRPRRELPAGSAAAPPKQRRLHNERRPRVLVRRVHRAPPWRGPRRCGKRTFRRLQQRPVARCSRLQPGRDPDAGDWFLQWTFNEVERTHTDDYETRDHLPKPVPWTRRAGA